MDEKNKVFDGKFKGMEKRLDRLEEEMKKSARSRMRTNKLRQMESILDVQLAGRIGSDSIENISQVIVFNDTVGSSSSYMSMWAKEMEDNEKINKEKDDTDQRMKRHSEAAAIKDKEVVRKEVEKKKTGGKNEKRTR